MPDDPGQGFRICGALRGLLGHGLGDGPHGRQRVHVRLSASADPLLGLAVQQFQGSHPQIRPAYLG